MDKIKVSILGSCVTREMFNYTDDFEVISTVYTSFISLFEEKLPICQVKQQSSKSLFSKFICEVKCNGFRNAVKKAWRKLFGTKK